MNGALDMEMNVDDDVTMELSGAQQFGAPLDGFDFSDLGLGLGNGNSILGFEGQFNPFALPQADDGSGSETMPEDDQTQFLHYILTKIANSQPEGTRVG